jgi:hypothetical protein
MNVVSIVAAFGGVSRMAQAVGVVPGAVGNWRRDGFPPRQVLTIWEAAKALGLKDITLEVLLRAEPEPYDKSDDTASRVS